MSTCDLTGWNGSKQMLIAFDNIIRPNTAVAIYRGSTRIFKGHDSGNAWNGLSKLSDSAVDLQPGDVLKVYGYNTGGPGAFFFNYINEQGYQLGLDDLNWRWDLNGRDQGPVQANHLAYGYGDLTSFQTAWHNGTMKIQHGDWNGRYNLANYKVWDFAKAGVGVNNVVGMFLTVPDYSDWYCYDSGQARGILRKTGVGNMSVGDTANDSANRINLFKDIKKSTTENSVTSLKEMRDWLRTYSANIGGFETGDRFSYSEFVNSIIWGAKIAVENESGRYANTNDGKISVEGVRGSNDWGGIFKFTLQGNGVYKSATTANRHTFTNLGGSATSSVNYVYRLTIQDVSAGNNVGFDVDVTVGHNTTGSKVTSVTSSANSFNKTNGQADVMTFTGQNVSGMSSFLTVLCKPRDV